MKRSVTILFAIISSASTAFAADVDARTFAKAPIADPLFNWSGFYLGVNAGYGLAHEEHDDLALGGGAFTFGPTGPLGGRQQISPTGATYGGQLGYNWQFAHWVLGAEGQLNGADIKRTDAGIFNIAPPTSLTAKVDAYATATARIGYALDNWLPYFKGGYAGAELKTSNFGPSTGVHFDERSWRDGYILGGGLEYGFASNWIVGVEYNYLDFGTRITTGVTINPNIPGASPERYSDRLTVQSVSARVGHKF
jgi:outer membrane immunogenic protein